MTPLNYSHQSISIATPYRLAGVAHMCRRCELLHARIIGSRIQPYLSHLRSVIPSP